MTATAPPTTSSRSITPAPDPTAVRAVPAALVLAAMAVALVGVCALHVTQGTSGIGLSDLLGLAGGTDDRTWDVLVGSRLPRLVAGLCVGTALGVAGAAFTSVARNPLASPEILGVSAGAFLSVTAAAAFGLALPVWGSSAYAFGGGLLAAGAVMVISAGGSSGPTRLLLAGSAVSLTLMSSAHLLLLLKDEATKGLFAWGNGTLLHINYSTTKPLAPVLLAAVGALIVLGGRLDVLSLGDDTASVLGVRVRALRVSTIVLAVLLTAVSVTIAGPVGFVGLSAPAIVRLVGSRVPGLLRHRVLIPAAGLTGMLVVIGSDALLRTVFGAQAGVEVPVGVVTSLWGSIFLIGLARRHRDSGPTRAAPAARIGVGGGPRRVSVVILVLGVAVAGLVCAGLLVGERVLQGGDLVAWVQGDAGIRVRSVLDARLPRVMAALLGGMALAGAGTTVQAVCRNPLAEPGVLGITAGAGLGAVMTVTWAPGSGLWAMTAAAVAGAILAASLVYVLSWRGGLSSDRLVLIGIGVAAGLAALTAMILIDADPFNTPKVLTWLTGSTYGRRLDNLVPVAVALVVLLPILAATHRSHDLLALDDDTPRVLGVRLERTRLLLIGAATLLAASSVSAVGVVSFVGLVAPHAARALVGGRHLRVLPVAVLLGGSLVTLADAVGRTVIAPAQIPAGLLTALIGTPYFAWLLWRSRA